MKQNNKINGKKKSVTVKSPVDNSIEASLTNKHKRNILLFFLLLISYVVFKGALKNDFVNWDDDVNVLENTNILSLDAFHLKKIFTDRVIGNYNPLPILSFALEYHFFGFNPYYYHLNNLLLHFVCVWLVFRIFTTLRFSDWASFAGALIFAIHPMKVESVVWITERKDVLFGLFYLSAILLYIKSLYQEKPRLLNHIALFLLFVLSLLSKIQAVSLPLTLLVIDFYVKGSLNFKDFLKKWHFFAFSLAFGLMGVFFLREQNSLQSLSESYALSDRILVGCKAYLLYIIKFLVPYRMSPLYPYPAKLSYEYYIAPFGILLVAGVMILAWKKKWKFLLTGMGIFTVNIMFLLQVVGAGQGLFADRFSYIPYLGFSFIIAWIWDHLKNSDSKFSTPWVVVCSLYLMTMAIICKNQTGIWENGGTLWTHVLKYYDNTTTPWQNRARYYRDHQQVDLAMADLTTAISLNSSRGTSYNSRAKIYFDQQKYKEALRDYDSSIYYDNKNAEAFINRGASHCGLNNYEAGIKDMLKGISLGPNLQVLKNAHKNLGLVYYVTSQYQQSKEHLDSLLILDPLMANAWYIQSLNYEKLGNPKQAMECINKCLELDPQNSQYKAQKENLMKR
jgi:Tfp pilus assembly protein PilF